MWNRQWSILAVLIIFTWTLTLTAPCNMKVCSSEKESKNKSIQTQVSEDQHFLWGSAVESSWTDPLTPSLSLLPNCFLTLRELVLSDRGRKLYEECWVLSSQTGSALVREEGGSVSRWPLCAHASLTWFSQQAKRQKFTDFDCKPFQTYSFLSTPAEIPVLL